MPALTLLLTITLILSRMVMDAKIETLTLIRNKLKDENAVMKADMEKMSKASRVGVYKG